MTTEVIARPQIVTARWLAVVTHRSQETGSVEVEYYFDEFSEFDRMIESGPDWNTISDIRITLKAYHGPATIEGAEEQ